MKRETDGRNHPEPPDSVVKNHFTFGESQCHDQMLRPKVTERTEGDTFCFPHLRQELSGRAESEGKAASEGLNDDASSPDLRDLFDNQ